MLGVPGTHGLVQLSEHGPAVVPGLEHGGAPRPAGLDHRAELAGLRVELALLARQGLEVSRFHAGHQGRDLAHRRRVALDPAADPGDDTGVGLALARTLVTHLGGALEAEALPGEARFVLVVPRGAEPPAG